MSKGHFQRLSYSMNWINTNFWTCLKNQMITRPALNYVNSSGLITCTEMDLLLL